MKIEKFIHTPKGTLTIDWGQIEERLGFFVHDNIKDFFSRIVCDDKFGFRGRIRFIREKFIKLTGHDEYDSFLFNNSNSNDFDSKGNDTGYYFNLLHSSDLENPVAVFEKMYDLKWAQIDNLGCKIHIGKLEHRIGNVDLFINNKTGQFEWLYINRNHSKDYEQNPNGLVAGNVEEFLKKFL